jgi:ABC-2 type transport system ATP-binding protein
MERDTVIETHNLARRYGHVEAVRALNLKISRHLVTGFLGCNGAGKSTTIRMLLGMTRPSEGMGSVLGRQITNPKDSREIRRHVAYVGEDKELYGYMTVREMIRFTASFYEDWQPVKAQRLEDQFELPASRKVKDLSKGTRTKLALLLALARRPELLILDEPSDGLDPVCIERFLQMVVSAAAEGTTVFFSSHQIAEVERIADRVCIIDRGTLVADLSLDEMRDHYRRITVGFSQSPPEHDFHIGGVQQIRTEGRQMVIWADGNSEAIVERAHQLGALSVDMAPVTLRDVFLETVKDPQ